MLSSMNPVSLQINLAPVDYPHVQSILPHQLRTIAPQCDEVLLVIDSKKHPRSKRFSPEGWEENKRKIDAVCENLKGEFPEIKTLEVDYSEPARKLLSEYFYGDASIRMPEKDFRGGPFYSYYYGLYAPKNDIIFHLDADVLLSGGSHTWVAEGVKYLENDPSLFCVCPLQGPPLEGGAMPVVKKNAYNPVGEYPQAGHGRLYNDFSTRVFMVDRKKLKENCRREYPNLDHLLKALWRGLPPYRYPEGTFSDLMKERKWFRLDFLGQNGGLWSYHPGFGGRDYFKFIDKFIRLAESNQFPEAQRGSQNVTEAFYKAALEA